MFYGICIEKPQLLGQIKVIRLQPGNYCLVYMITSVIEVSFNNAYCLRNRCIPGRKTHGVNFHQVFSLRLFGKRSAWPRFSAAS